MHNALIGKFEVCREMYSLLAEIPDARIRFHLHCTTASVCKVFYIVRLVPPTVSARITASFDAAQRCAYCSLDGVKLTAAASQQMPLPLKMEVMDSPPSDRSYTPSTLLA